MTTDLKMKEIAVEFELRARCAKWAQSLRAQA